jgi:hypothetical protein
VDWIVRPVKTGTLADTPHSLRRKAQEFLRLAGEAKTPEAYQELTQLADRYMRRSWELEAASLPSAESEIAVVSSAQAGSAD